MTGSTPLRKPPWLKVFASDDLSGSAYFGLTCGERGVLDTLRRLAWLEDGPLPAAPRLLARLARLDEPDLVANFSPAVKAHLQEVDGGYVFPEVERQHEEVRRIRKQQSEGGKVGAEKTNSMPAKPRKEITLPDESSGTCTTQPASTHPTQPASGPACQERVPALPCPALPCSDEVPTPVYRKNSVDAAGNQSSVSPAPDGEIMERARARKAAANKSLSPDAVAFLKGKWGE